MPLPVTDFSRFLHNPDYSGISDMFKNYYQGYEMGQTPEKLAQERLSRELQNKIFGVEADYAEPMAQQGLQKSQLENQYYGQEKQAHIAQMLAGAEHSQAQAKRANMGGDFSGTLGNLVRLHQLKQNPGADPNLIAALEAQVKLDREREQGILNYQNKVSDSLYYRSAPESQKYLMNIDSLGNNETYDMEGNKVKLTPEQAQQRRNIMGKEILKNTTDPALRQRLEYATNLNTTLQNINPDKAFRYSGGLGAIAKAANKGVSSLTGKQSEEYKKFEKNLTALEIAAHQASQFFDLASAQKIQKDIKTLVNPQTWLKSPEVAKAKYETLVNLFEQEHNNMLKSAVDPSQYGLDIKPALSPQEQRVQETSNQIMSGFNNTNKSLTDMTDEELMEALNAQ